MSDQEEKPKIKYHKLNSKGQGKQLSILNTYQKSELANLTAGWILEGKPKRELMILIREYSPLPLSDSNIEDQILYARSFLEEITEMDAQKIIAIHIAWYEEIYMYFHKIDHAEGMNKAMKAKERLLGIHKRDNRLVINKKTNVNITRETTYDLSKLSEEQKVRLQVLSDKMK